MAEKKEELELEEAVGKLANRLKNISDSRILLPGIPTKELKETLERVWNFIDVCKLTFGEDVTKM